MAYLKGAYISNRKEIKEAFDNIRKLKEKTNAIVKFPTDVPPHYQLMRKVSINSLIDFSFNRFLVLLND
jgi:hypothetical protein